jgi:glycosyltransferase involved in cell wall biosynthesis
MRDVLPATRADVAVLFGKELARYGITSDLVGQAEPGAPLPEASAWPAGELWQVGVAAKGIRGELVRTWYDLWGLLAHLRDRHDIVQVRDKIRTGVLGLVAARLLRKPFVYWMSYPIAEGHASRAAHVGRSQGWIVWIANKVRAWAAGACYYGLICRHADHVFVQSDAMLRHMEERGVRRERMTAVPMGVDVDAFAAVTAAPVVPEVMRGRRVIAYLGQLSQDRRSDFLLEVVKELSISRPDVLLLLAGDAPSADEQAWIRRRIVELGVERHVWLTGWLPQRQALPLMKLAEVGLSPIPRGSLFDISSPTKAVEYLALGLPVVVNDIPDQQQVVAGSGAGFCVPMTVPAFAAAVERLLADPAGAVRMGASGPDWAATHRAYGTIARRIVPVYQALGGRPHVHGRALRRAQQDGRSPPM